MYDLKSGYYYEQIKYLPKRPADLSGLSERERRHIDVTLDKYSNKSAKALSDLSHEDIPWISAKDGEVIDYESVFYRTDATSVRSYEAD
nr:type II toxin-antitoxin system antitoxin SocA domain-containing protein [Candidatus Endomicrobium trichonymphae]